jgi:hypothetical protein
MQKCIKICKKPFETTYMYIQKCMKLCKRVKIFKIVWKYVKMYENIQKSLKLYKKMKICKNVWKILNVLNKIYKCVSNTYVYNVHTTVEDNQIAIHTYIVV